MRMWLVQQLKTIVEYLENLLKTMTMRAEIEIDICMPGYGAPTTSNERGEKAARLTIGQGILIYNEPNRECNILLDINFKPC